MRRDRSAEREPQGTDRAGSSSGELPPAEPVGKRRANGVAHGHAITDVVVHVAALYRRERRLRRAARRAKAATDRAAAEAAKDGVEYERMARGVVPAAKDGDDIARVRAQRKRFAARLRKRVQRWTARHTSSRRSSESPLPVGRAEPQDVGEETNMKDYYLRKRVVEEFAPVPALEQPVDDELEGPEDLGERADLGEDDPDDDYDDEDDDLTEDE